MKVIIDGNEVECLNDVKVIYEDEMIGMNDREQECFGQLHVTMTCEGMIADLIEDGSDEVDRTMAWETLDIIERCI